MNSITVLGVEEINNRRRLSKKDWRERAVDKIRDKKLSFNTLSRK